MSFPDLSDAFWDWTDTVTFKVISTVIADYEVTETAVNADLFQGVLEPLSAQALKILPENQRTWKFWTLWTTYRLQPGQVVQDGQGLQYRVMQAADWTRGGHFQYQLSQDPDLDVVVPVEA